MISKDAILGILAFCEEGGKIKKWDGLVTVQQNIRQMAT